jgi:heat-inducible transcriptional repressor
LNLSAATIRNVLAELEEDGFLTHPHTSAGRVPTDRGYRFYVNSIVNIQRLAVEEERRIKDEYARRRREIEDLLSSTTRVLSALSNCTGFILPPMMDSGIEKLRRVELIPVKDNQVLAVLVSDSGFVRDQIILLKKEPDEESLRSVTRYLNERLSGLSFTEAQTRLLAEMDDFHRQKDEQHEILLSLSKLLFGPDFKKDLYVEGAGNLLKFPEFQDYESMRQFSRLVDEKQALGEVLKKSLTQEGLQVKIGMEYSPELKDFAVVSTTYQMHGRLVGALGILGPKRMHYERMMAIVNTVAKIMNNYLEGKSDFGELEDKNDQHR